MHLDRNFRRIMVVLLAGLLIGAIISVWFFRTAKPEIKSGWWVVGYLPGYSQDADGGISYMAPADWKTVTHVIHNAALPKPDGSLDTEANKVSPLNRRNAILTAHEASIPILFGVGGWGETYQTVVNDPVLRQTLIRNILAVVDEGYDGVDIDFEPVVAWGKEAEGNPGYEAFIQELHRALLNRKTPLLEQALLTVAVGYRERALIARLQDQLDMINLMLYDQAGVMSGITWHDSALYDGGYTYPSTGELVSSVDRFVRLCLDAGINAQKLNLGINLETRLWVGGEGTSTGGVSMPRQTWTKPPKHFMTDSVPQESYAELLDKYYSPEYYHWDDKAKVPYLQIDKPGSQDDMFISFNDEKSVVEKIKYMQEKSMGGIMLWHLGMDYRPLQPDGKRRPIIQAIRNELSR